MHDLQSITSKKLMCVSIDKNEVSNDAIDKNFDSYFYSYYDSYSLGLCIRSHTTPTKTLQLTPSLHHTPIPLYQYATTPLIVLRTPNIDS